MVEKQVLRLMKLDGEEMEEAYINYLIDACGSENVTIVEMKYVNKKDKKVQLETRPSLTIDYELHVKLYADLNKIKFMHYLFNKHVQKQQELIKNLKVPNYTVENAYDFAV